MSQLLFFIVMFCGGVMIALQPSINARLAQKVGVFESSCVSFAVGTAALLLFVLLAGKGSLRAVGGASWWELTGGLLGAFFVTATIIVVPRLGTTATFAAVIAAQLTTGILLDQFGLFGLRQIPMDGRRGLGVFLLMAGAALVFRR
jgi:bacterial/archaeal transporter family-2 protein